MCVWREVKSPTMVGSVLSRLRPACLRFLTLSGTHQLHLTGPPSVLPSLLTYLLASFLSSLLTCFCTRGFARWSTLVSCEKVSINVFHSSKFTMHLDYTCSSKEYSEVNCVGEMALSIRPLKHSAILWSANHFPRQSDGGGESIQKRL